MKKTIILIILPFFCYSQYDYAVKLHNIVREVYSNYSIDYSQLDENGYGKLSKITYSNILAEEAQKRAEKLAEEFFKWHEKDQNKNFWFTEISIGSDGSKIYLEDREYVTNAVLKWAQLEFDYNKYLNDENLCYDPNDISDFLKLVWVNNRMVGFGIAKNENHVFVVASYGMGKTK